MEDNIQNFISVQDFAEQMSKNVPFGTNKIYAMIKEPGFPSVKVGGRYYVLIDKVNEWLEKQNYKRTDLNEKEKGSGQA